MPFGGEELADYRMISSYKRSVMQSFDVAFDFAWISCLTNSLHAGNLRCTDAHVTSL